MIFQINCVDIWFRRGKCFYAMETALRWKQTTFYFLLSLTFGVALHAQNAASDLHGPPAWEGHNPIHIRGNVTTAPTGYSPAKIRHAYGFDQITANGAGQT